MNYLQLINKVLVKLREAEVGTVSDTDYSALIGSFVNEAKHEVESAWNWASLRTSIDLSIVPGTSYYETGLHTDSILLRDPEDRRLPMAFCITTGFSRQVYQLPVDYVDKQRIINENVVVDVTPQHFSLPASGGIWAVQFLETPSAARTYRLFFKVPQDELEEGVDPVIVPWRPIVALATMLALNERGEEIGEPGNIAEIRYKNYLANAISLEAVQSAEQLVAEPE